MTSHTVWWQTVRYFNVRFYLHWTLPCLELSFMISIIFSSSPFTIIVIIINAVKYLIITKRIRNLSVSKVTLSIVTEAQWGQSTSVVEIIPMMELLKINHTRTVQSSVTSDQHSLSRELTILWLPICFRVRNFSRSRFRLSYNKKKFL